MVPEQPSRRGNPGLWSWAGSLCLVLSAMSLLHSIAFARGPAPALRIPLEPLGFATISNRYLLEGATMLTVNYVDKDHLLVTFGVSRLMKRLPDCPKEDEDRIVKAVLLELPTAKVLAETEWRFHDLGQYLWDLGGGTFLLRQREALTTFTPLAGRGGAGAFALHPFMKFDRRIEAILVSADHDLLSIETVKKKPAKDEASAATTAGGPQAPPTTPGHSLVLQRRDATQNEEEEKPTTAPVEINFVRLTHRPADPVTGGSEHIVAAVAGMVHTKIPVYLPLTTEGFLETKGKTRDGVLFDFITFTGKQIELGDFATSCSPSPNFVSQSEFVAFGCRGTDESVDLAGFNLRGDLIWQMNFSESQAYPSILAAVPAGRFALSRTLTVSTVFGSETPSMSQLTGQEVRVVQMYNGKVLLKVMTSPIQRAGQNFAISPDGMALAIVHDNTTVKGTDPVHDTVHDPAVEIYTLPPLSGKDQKEIAAEVALAPEPANARMRFSMAEIKTALARKPGAAADEDVQPEDTEESRRVTHADERIVGDPIPPPPANAQPAPETGSLPSTAAAPVCAGLADKSAGCPIQDKSAPAETVSQGETAVQGETAGSETAAQGDAERQRKPPTLYAPGEAAAPSSKATPSKPQP